MARQAFKQVQSVPAPEPQARIDTNSQSRRDQAEGYADGLGMGDGPENPFPESIALLHAFASAKGDISDLLKPGQAEKLGVDAVQQWETDDGSRMKWKTSAQRYLDMAAQENPESDEEVPDDEAFGSADIDYPILTTSSQQFAARAGPELIRSDKVVGIK